jgi:hypothetical protein
LQKKTRLQLNNSDRASLPGGAAATPDSAAASTGDVAAGTDQHSLDLIEVEMKLKKIAACHEAARAAILNAKVAALCFTLCAHMVCVC